MVLVLVLVLGGSRGGFFEGGDGFFSEGVLRERGRGMGII